MIMRKYIIVMTLLLCSLTAMAQEQKPDTVIITLRNGTEVRYTSDQFDRVQVIFNLHYGVKVYLKDGKSKDYLAAEVRIAEYHGGGMIVDNNKNRNLYRAKLLEYPHLAADSTMNQLIVKSTSDYGITYSLEWSYQDKANRWTCYQMHSGNMYKNVERTKPDPFTEDGEIPEEYRSTLDDYKGSGFSRGHLCPSADRLCSKEQNTQTFLLSNMQPQWQYHNGGLWVKFENKVRTWAENCDTLYVVKAATIRSDQLYPEKCNDKLPVPKYFYMALLSYKKSTNEYEAIGIWTQQYKTKEDDPYQTQPLSFYAISIDELEERTGIDFFCNLPDDEEEKVEKAAHIDYWGLTEQQ